MTVVNEPGLYTLILSSRKPEARKAFKRWITHEVIPSIRKTGSYIRLLLERIQKEPAVIVEFARRLIGKESRKGS